MAVATSKGQVDTIVWFLIFEDITGLQETSFAPVD